MSMLTNRFLCSARPLIRFARLFGIDLDMGNYGRKKLIFTMIWSWLWLILNFTSNAVITIRRFMTKIMNMGEGQGNLSTVNDLMRLLNRVSMMVSNVIIHFVLVAKIRKKMADFLNCLETVDYNFSRPDLSSIRRYSILGVIWIVLTVTTIHE